MQTKGGIRKRPQRRRGTLPVLNPPAVTLQKLLYPGTPLCNLEAKDPAATLSLILDGGKNIHFGARQKRVRILVPLLVLGENLPLRPHPPLRSGTSPARERECTHGTGTGPGTRHAPGESCLPLCVQRYSPCKQRTFRGRPNGISSKNNLREH